MEQEQDDISTKTGLENSSLIIYNDRVAVGLRYVAGETYVPFVTGLAKTSDTVLKLLKQAKELNIPLVERDELPNRLVDQNKVGDYLRDETFYGNVAEALLEAGLV